APIDKRTKNASLILTGIRNAQHFLQLLMIHSSFFIPDYKKLLFTNYSLPLPFTCDIIQQNRVIIPEQHLKGI
ncbi:MAG: hypothetical protein IJ171_03240, partial [Ruminococcus sp.]|nr:hypothetical protein [Ruminococcus sp.]